MPRQLSVAQGFEWVKPAEHETVAKLCKKLELSDSYAGGLIETGTQNMESQTAPQIMQPE